MEVLQYNTGFVIQLQYTIVCVLKENYGMPSLFADMEIATSFPNRVSNRSSTDDQGCETQLWNAFQPLKVDGCNSTLRPEQSSEDKAIKLMAPPASVSPAGMMKTQQPISSIDRNRQIAPSQMMTHSAEEPTETSKVNLIRSLKFRGN